MCKQGYVFRQFAAGNYVPFFVLITYITSAPLVPVAVILLGLAIIFGGRGSGSLRNS